MPRINNLGPVGFNPTGNYDETRQYERLDVVYYEGSSYVATADSVGQLPTNTEYWDILVGNEEVEFIFPKFWEDSYSGDANLIKYGNKNILIDCYSSTDYENLVEMLTESDVNHIDYFILTHYHGDHDGNVENLINDEYLDSNTSFFMPAEVENFDKTEVINQYKSLFTQHNLIYHVPTENEEVIINNLKLKFYNCDATYLDTYYTDYNSCSTIVLLTFKNIKALYTGDAQADTLKRLREEEFVKGQIDLYKIEHHGINITTDKKFLENISPSYAVQTSGPLDEALNKFSECQTIKALHDMNTRIYPTNRQTDYLKFVSEGSNISCINGVEYATGIGIADATYYVDSQATTDSIQDGTEEHPFSEVMQAITYALNTTNNIININLADGNYCDSTQNSVKDTLTIRNSKDRIIRVFGNSNDKTAVTLNSVRLYNSQVQLNDLTVQAGHLTYPGIICNESDLILNNVLITTEDGEAGNYTALNITNQSNAIVNNSEIEKCSTGIYLERSFLNIASLTYGEDVTTKLTKANASQLITGSITFATNAEKYAFYDNYKNVRTPINLYSTTSTSKINSIPLNRSVANFDWIEIEYTDSGRYFHKSTGKVYTHNQTNIMADILYKNNSGNLVCKTASFQVQNSTITITNHLTTTIANGTNPTVDASGDNAIRIERVTGGFDNAIAD